MFDSLVRGFEIRNSKLLTFESWLSERQNQPRIFIVHPPFKVIPYHTASPRLF